ncbi:unnamed protein product [Paramecium octaurelia]|uniref:Uncharacterized protein n=1 Tax=Paramecium octaurelia TaxID=43137 RepID=A0A8S1YCZ3_PAROT|nr:unnamed protein product [Paramecium octaurelia]
MFYFAFQVRLLQDLLTLDQREGEKLIQQKRFDNVKQQDCATEMGDQNMDSDVMERGVRNIQKLMKVVKGLQF